MIKPVILVVDDDESIGDMLKMMLEYKGYRVFISQDTNDLEQKLMEYQVNLVILDILIGHVKGTEVCQALKSKTSFVNLPVLMMTALPGMEKICLEAGADDFIAKPFEMADLLSKIGTLCRQ